MNDKYVILHTMFRERVNTLPHIGTTNIFQFSQLTRELGGTWDHIFVSLNYGAILKTSFCLCLHVLIVIFNPDIFPTQILPKERL